MQDHTHRGGELYLAGVPRRMRTAHVFFSPSADTTPQTWLPKKRAKVGLCQDDPRPCAQAPVRMLRCYPASKQSKGKRTQGNPPKRRDKGGAVPRGLSLSERSLTRYFLNNDRQTWLVVARRSLLVTIEQTPSACRRSVVRVYFGLFSTSSSWSLLSCRRESER